jgi:hypothetical protein
MAIVNVKFVSEWNHDTRIVTQAKLDESTGRVFYIEPATKKVVTGEITREYIILDDGTEKDVDYDHSDPDSEVYVKQEETE